MIKVILDQLRQYFSLTEAECKEYQIPEDVDFLQKQIQIASSSQADFLLTTFDFVTQSSLEGKWIVTDGIELPNDIAISEKLLESIPNGILICLKVESGQYHILSETATNWFLCTGQTTIPKQYWIKYK